MSEPEGPRRIVVSTSIGIESGGWGRPPRSKKNSTELRLEYIPKHRTGPRTKPVQDKIQKKLAEMGEAPAGMSIANQAKRIGESKRSLERYFARNKF
jgi:hypothetical protein